MKIELPCAVVRDLLPSYVDNLTCKETMSAVESHLETCEECRKIKDNMLSENKKPWGDDARLLKKLKKKLNRRTKIVIAASVSAVIICLISFNLLFNAPLKSVRYEDVTVTASVYPASVLEKSPASDSYGVKISSDENDKSPTFQITIPDIPNAQIAMTDDALEKSGAVTAVSWSSPYVLKEIEYDIKDDIVYISSFKTTLLGSKASKYNFQSLSLEMRKINKIVYQKNGTQTVLWQNE